jgi:hypothetical protein
MQFEEQTISIVNFHHEREEILAMVGVGSGLAYYEVAGEGYAITTVSSGYAVAKLYDLATIFTVHAARDESIAQRFIEQITPLLNWNTEAKEIVQQARERYPHSVFHELRKIFLHVCEQAKQQQATA